LPALPDDPDPFEGEGADGGVMVFVFGALAVVVSAGPERVLNRLSSKLMKGLAKELGTKVTPTDAEEFAAALDDGSDAGEGWFVTCQSCDRMSGSFANLVGPSVNGEGRDNEHLHLPVSSKRQL
jgi:hypothetical protein